MKNAYILNEIHKHLFSKISIHFLKSYLSLIVRRLNRLILLLLLIEFFKAIIIGLDCLQKVRIFFLIVKNKNNIIFYTSLALKDRIK